MNNNYLTVSEINRYIKNKFDNDVGLANVYLKGEISNFKAHPTGHLYFTIKDETSRILGVMFAGNARKIKFKPNDGDKVLIIGRVGVYEASGNYQIYVDDMILDGVGNLYLEYEKLKKKLDGLGYFKKEHKKSIPKYPKKIGVITASSGAAIRDIMTTIDRRYRLAEVILFSSLVQGVGAKEDIVKNIEIANKYDLDVIILGRGGGSIEDLWAFNEEMVAQAIYNSNIPIISAVGHEVDFTISDFVADLRAATPTAAAELAVPNTRDLLNEINNYKLRGSKSIINKIRNQAEILAKLKNSYVLKNPINLYEIKFQKLDNLMNRLISANSANIEKHKNKFLNVLNKLETLNPILTLKRGYAIVSVNNNPISSIKNLKKEEELSIELQDGTINTKILNVEEKNERNQRKIF